MDNKIITCEGDEFVWLNQQILTKSMALGSDIDALEYVSMGLRIEMVESWAESMEGK